MAGHSQVFREGMGISMDFKTQNGNMGGVCISSMSCVLLSKILFAATPKK